MLPPLSTYSFYELRNEMIRLICQEQEGLPVSERYKRTLAGYMRARGRARNGG